MGMRAALWGVLGALMVACGAGQDTAATSPPEDAKQVADAAGADTTTFGGSDAASTVGSDADAADTAKVEIDAGGNDTLAETSGDAGLDSSDGEAATKCSQDADCGSGFSACLVGACNPTTGKCELKAAADGTACAAKGNCGGVGVCKQGACNYASACTKVPCQAKPLACGDTVVVSLSEVSTVATYSCSPTAWDGGEAVFSLAAEVTSVATVELSGAATASATLIDIGFSGGTCLANGCGVTGQKVVLGLPNQVTHTLVVETVKGATGPLKLSVTCTGLLVCGDGTCNGSETKVNCPKDCGSAGPSACGDGTCSDAEGCDLCPQDCGSCPPECTAKTAQSPNPAGCGGCACEACVCGKGDGKMGDVYCCTTAWDSLCVSECSNDCKGPKCAAPAACGDNVCQAGETTANCPNDCPPLTKCGDGVCAATEACTNCPGDCGVCPGGLNCGDGKCSAGEHCGVCPQDCGTCGPGPACLPQKGPGCPGCACETCVCKKDPYCCDNAWDGTCVSECSIDCGGGACPVASCGDGMCSTSETCANCSQDCGACPPPASIGCQGHCGSSSKDAAGKTCWCDSFCSQSGDCCADKVQECGK